MTGEELTQFERTLGHHFTRPEWLEQALTHRSARQREAAPPPDDNDRLEFFGDRVIGLAVSEYLLKTFPDWDAGKLSKAHSRLVSGTSIRSAAEAIAIGRHLRLGRGEEMTGGREKQSLLADAYEAVVAAIYLDAGLHAASEFIRRTLPRAGAERRGGSASRIGSQIGAAGVGAAARSGTRRLSRSEGKRSRPQKVIRSGSLARRRAPRRLRRPKQERGRTVGRAQITR